MAIVKLYLAPPTQLQFKGCKVMISCDTVPGTGPITYVTKEKLISGFGIVTLLRQQSTADLSLYNGLCQSLENTGWMLNYNGPDPCSEGAGTNLREGIHPKLNVGGVTTGRFHTPTQKEREEY